MVEVTVTLYQGICRYLTTGEKTLRKLCAVWVGREFASAFGFPFQTATGEMIFHVDNYTLTAEQILSLLDNNHLDREGMTPESDGSKCLMWFRGLKDRESPESFWSTQTQLEALIAATFANVKKEVQALFTLAHVQVALTNSLLQYV